MERVEVNVTVRTSVGKGPSVKARVAKKIPVIFYGPHVKAPVPLEMDAKEFGKMTKIGSNTFLVLKSADSPDVDGKVAILKDRQIHPVSRMPLHADLYEVRMDEAIKVRVPVAFVGKAEGVIEGGILQTLARDLEVRCLPTDIPDRIDVDVTALVIGDSLHVSDITLPKGLSLVGTVNYTVVAVVPPEAEEVAATPVVAEGAAAVPGATPAPGTAPAAGAAPAAGGAPAAAGAAAGKAGAAGKPAAAAGKPAADKGEGKAKQK